MKENNETSSVKKSKAPLYISAAIILGIVAAYFMVPQVQVFLDEAWSVLTSNDEDRIRSWVSEFGWIGPLVLILTMVLPQ
ncbi:hypothetical protein BH23BAC2_BH23BAC2_09760 [soil metagenome]